MSCAIRAGNVSAVFDLRLENVCLNGGRVRRLGDVQSVCAEYMRA